MAGTASYRIVRLPNGANSVHSLAHHETFHPVVGPVAEADALYVRQLDIINRVGQHAGEFVVWDVGLGAAANSITFLRATRDLRVSIRMVSFDHTLEPLGFALEHTDSLPYLKGYEHHLHGLLTHRQVSFRHEAQNVEWDLHVADFPSFLQTAGATRLPKPHVVMFDAFSPAKNPAMWTQQVFSDLFHLLDPRRPCALPTYSRSTMLRVTLLLAGFFVGVGHATGQKEETTIAANTPDLIVEPLDCRWLQRAHRSTSAEPLQNAAYRQARLSQQGWEKLQRHPQFSQPEQNPFTIEKRQN